MDYIEPFGGMPPGQTGAPFPKMPKGAFEMHGEGGTSDRDPPQNGNTKNVRDCDGWISWREIPDFEG